MFDISLFLLKAVSLRKRGNTSEDDVLRAKVRVCSLCVLFWIQLPEKRFNCLVCPDKRANPAFFVNRVGIEVFFGGFVCACDYILCTSHVL